jgi:hypothetical protein
MVYLLAINPLFQGHFRSIAGHPGGLFYHFLQLQ